MCVIDLQHFRDVIAQRRGGHANHAIAAQNSLAGDAGNGPWRYFDLPSDTSSCMVHSSLLPVS
jgi:hypothetical protein